MAQYGRKVRAWSYKQLAEWLHQPV